MSVNGNNARKILVEKYRENSYEIERTNKILKINNYLRPEDRMPKGEINRVIEEMTKSIEQEKRRKRENERKRRMRKTKEAKRSKFTGNIKKTVTALFFTGILLAGGYTVKNAYDWSQQQNAPITLKQALENGEDLNSLGIDSNILLEMQDIEEMLEKGNLTNEEIIKLAPRISALQFDTAKAKLANTLGVSEDEIRLYTRPVEEGQTRETVKTSNGIYINKDIFTYENTIPPEVSDYIKEIGKMQDVMQKLQEGNINREEILAKYGEMLEKTSQIAASKMKVDEKGNISVEQTKVSDLDKQSEKKIATLDQEQNEGEERE